ncbi:MAG: M28 family peptidase [Crocinitomicaceae bacterium]|nr:M28 family peptidase [Crocinitomicaceae bacterium]
MNNKVVVSCLILAGLVFHVDHASGQRDSVAMYYASGINTADLKKHLFILSSDEYEGRETGTRGQKKAAQYIADYYQSLGLPAINDGSYFQQFPLKKETFEKSTLETDGRTFGFIKDFYFFHSFPLSDNFPVEDAIFCGYGIETGRYSDYKGVNVKNKTVVILSGEPQLSDGKSLITGSMEISDWSVDPSTKVDLARSKGAKSVLIIIQDYDHFIPRVRYWLENATLRLDYPEKDEKEKVLPFFFISPRVADYLLAPSGKGAVATIEEMISKRKKTVHFKVKREANIHVERTTERVTAENVLGFIEGTDPVLKDEIIVVSAHYDHIGIVNGVINNGADDDGSGTVTTLELAKVFMKARKEGHGTKRSILFLNVSGEEKGLLGSEWYAAFPVFPLDKTVCDLNIDMIGRKDEKHEADPNYVYLIGSDKLSTELHAISEKANKTYTKLELDYTFNDPADPNRFYYRSDHYNFAKHDIPVIFYFSGVHEDYHQPGDDPEKILFDKMNTIGKLIFYTAWELANRPERIRVDVKSDFPNRK